MIIKLTNGRWKARVWQNGRGSKRISKTFDRYKDAANWERETMRSLAAGTYTAPKTIPTFRQVAAEWLAGKADKRPGTVAAWQTHLDLHLLPRIGETRLDQITTATIEKLVRDPLRAKGLSPKTVNKVLTTAAAVFKKAVRLGYCTTNPLVAAERLGNTSRELIDNAEEQRRSHSIEVLPDEVLSAPEIGLLLAKADAGFSRTLLMTAVLTGLRDGELLAMRWSDIEFDAGKLYVRRYLSWARLRNSAERPQPRFYLPKTESGRRSIPLAPELTVALKQWKLQCPKSDFDLIFPTVNGAPAHRSNILKRSLYPALRRGGLRKVSLHSLRHSFASMLIMQGTVITEVQYLLGHSSPQTTLKVYSHFFRNANTNSVQLLARNLIGGPSVDPASASALNR